MIYSARYPVVIDPFFQQAKLTASDGAKLDFFGDSVAVTGDTVVVGARLDSLFDDLVHDGSAYVFVKPAGGWAGVLIESAKLTASDTRGFGYSVAVSGDTVVVGSFPGSFPGPETVYVFVKPAGGWAGALTETAKLTASDGDRFDHDDFGIAVAVSGDTVVVGARSAQIRDNLLGQGAAYVFVKPAGGAGWTPRRTPSSPPRTERRAINSASPWP